MKKCFVAIAFVCLAISQVHAQSQTAGTTLVINAHWDDKTAVAGTVVIAEAHPIGPDTVLATRALTTGSASITVPLASNSIYDVTLSTPTGTQLVKFPFTTALVNTQNVQRGAISLVLRKADNSVKSADVRVLLDF